MPKTTRTVRTQETIEVVLYGHEVMAALVAAGYLTDKDAIGAILYLEHNYGDRLELDNLDTPLHVVFERVTVSKGETDARGADQKVGADGREAGPAEDRSDVSRHSR